MQRSKVGSRASGLCHTGFFRLVPLDVEPVAVLPRRVRRGAQADRRGAEWAGRAPATLHGSFGSGESHFMAVLHALLRADVDARSRPELADTLAPAPLGRGKSASSSCPTTSSARRASRR